MAKISNIQQANGEYYVVITRKNGSSYKVRSESYEAVMDYKVFFLSQVKHRSR